MSKKWVHKSQLLNHPDSSDGDKPQDWIEVEYNENAGTAAAVRAAFEIVNESSYPLRMVVSNGGNHPRLLVQNAESEAKVKDE